MIRTAKLAGLSVLGLLAAAVASVDAQIIVQPVQPVRPHRPHQVEIRQVNWKAGIFMNAAQAQSFAQTKAARGYEVVQELLPGQIQVRYRMPAWHLYAVVPHRHEAHDLARVLQAKGYEVRVVH